MWFDRVVLASWRCRSWAPPALLGFLLASGLSVRAQRPLPDEEILQYLQQTISWYRDVAAFLQSPADAREAQFADGLRRSSTKAVQSAFEFARAQATIPAGTAPENATPDRSRTLAQSAAAAEQRAEQAQQEIEQINRQLQTAPKRSRARLLALRDEVTSEGNFAKARRDALRSLIGFLGAPEEGGLAARIGELERSVPEAAASGQKGTVEPVPGARPVALPEFHPESSGIVGLTTEVFSVSQRMKRLDHLSQETDALRQANEKLRAPLRGALRDVIRRGDAVAQAPESSDVAALTAGKKELDVLAVRFKQLSTSSVPLSEQAAEIGASRGRILEWRGALKETYGSTWRYLVLRIGMLGVALALVFGFSELWRRGTMRYVQDLRRRRQVLLMRRIVVGCAVALVLVLGFVTEFGSLATFAGFSAAGIAVAMQSVILSMVAYFFLVGRWGVRVGDRVTVSGVTGEVADVGLFRLYLMELGPALQPTGRMVVFPNSVFFQPAAMFKQLPGIDYVWRSITLRLAETADYAQVERRLLDAVESIYGEYRETVERQHRTVQASLGVHTVAPRPESRVRFLDSGLEITIRYPVEIGRAAEIDDRITREVIRQAGGATRIEVKEAQ
jgi:small-conductance mechanosensitive channel